MYDCQNVLAAFILDCTCMLTVHGLPFLGYAVKPCTEGLHMQSDMNVTGTLWGSYIRGGDTTVYLSVLGPRKPC